MHIESIMNKKLYWTLDIKVWAYKDYNLLPGYPKIVYDTLYPFNPFAAVNKDGDVYLLKVRKHNDRHAYVFEYYILI